MLKKREIRQGACIFHSTGTNQFIPTYPIDFITLSLVLSTGTLPEQAEQTPEQAQIKKALTRVPSL